MRPYFQKLLQILHKQRQQEYSKQRLQNKDYVLPVLFYYFVYLADILSAFCIPMGCEGTLIDLPFI